MKRKLLVLAGIIGICSVMNAGFQKPASQADTYLEAARLNNLGAAYMNQQLFEKALRNFEQAAKVDPKLAIAMVNQAVALLNLGKVAQAQPLLEAAVKQRPEDPNAWYNLGLLYKNSNNIPGAIDALRHVTQIDPNDADTWYFLGAAYAQGRQFTQAIDAFQHALKLNPLHASAQFGLARAYQQSGEAAQAREHLQRFQYITQNKIGAPISLAYGEQGKYSLAEESPQAPQKVPPEIKVKFVDVTANSGLNPNPSISEPVDMASFLGPGACFLDYDGDGKPDVFIADNGPNSGLALYHNQGGGRFDDVTRSAGLNSSLHAVGCTAGDYDNDGATDLAVTFKERIILYHNEKNGTFKDVTGAARIKGESLRGEGAESSVGFNLSPTFVDYDHDGDLDLYVTRIANTAAPAKIANQPVLLISKPQFPSVMWRNNGNGTFTDVTEMIGLAGKVPTINTIATDYNNDRAIDIAATHWDKAPSIYENPREGQFIPREPWAGNMSTLSMGMAVVDFNHDGWMDLAFTHWDSPGVTLWRNEKGKSFQLLTLPTPKWVHGWGVVAIDYDNDGWVDLAAVGETNKGAADIRLFRNLGPDGWKDVTSDVGLENIELKAPRSIVAADYDGDGAIDLLITQNHGPATLLRNVGGNQNHWLKLSLKGLADNKSAIGTKVEVYAGGVHQKFEIAGSSGYLGQNSTELNVGLGTATQADIVRMLWPMGVLQDEIEVRGNREAKYIEIDRRGSSCPTLFVWNGYEYELAGDMLGAGVIGHWVGPGQRNIPRPAEYIKLDRNSVRERVDSHVSQERGDIGHPTLSFRFMEPLEEAVYLDRVELLAVDHPATIEVYPNEYFASNPPYPSFKVVFSRDGHPPAGAWDDGGHNVLPDLLAHRYVGRFDLLPFKGFAKMHSLELNLGEPYGGGPLWLLAHGEIEYFTATGMYAADQAGIQPVSPYVEALVGGKWKRVVNDMGFPAGGPRTMTADLTGKLPAGTRRIRISTNLQIYWDSILISRTDQHQQSRVTPLPLTRANLRFHGFPLKVEGDPPGNVKYVYEKVSTTGPYTRPAGSYTRYGDVKPLLIGSDDKFAVFGSGDEVGLEFDPAKLPPLPKGWVRDYFFAANGFEKDMDFYAYDPTSVDPLPFHAMKTYPYPKGKSFPMDDSHINYLLDYNTRQMSGNEARGFAFDYTSAK